MFPIIWLAKPVPPQQMLLRPQNIRRRVHKLPRESLGFPYQETGHLLDILLSAATERQQNYRRCKRKCCSSYSKAEHKERDQHVGRATAHRHQGSAQLRIRLHQQVGAAVGKLGCCALAVPLSRGQAYRAGRFAVGQHQPGRTLAAVPQRQLCVGDAPPVLQPTN